MESAIAVPERPDGESICSLFKTLTRPDLSDDNYMLSWQVLKELADRARDDNPMHISFSGDKESYIGFSTILSSIHTTPVSLNDSKGGDGLKGSLPKVAQSIRGFSVSLWLKIDLTSFVMGFLLFRCRSQSGGIDAILSSGQPDGRWTITLRSYGDSNSKVDVKGQVLLIPGQWQHIIVKQSYLSNSNNPISVWVNGILEMENNLPYPFCGASNQYQWIVGLGLKGIVSTVAFFDEDLASAVIGVLYELGPNSNALAFIGTRFPQSSYDTGYTHLGSRLTKGPLAQKLARVKCSFHLSGKHFIDSCPAVPAGRVEGDTVELVASSIDLQNQWPFSPMLSSGCSLVKSFSWEHAWNDAGGCKPVLYLLGALCAHTEMNDMILSCIHETYSLLIQLIKSSVDIKEQFIQLHGFHLVGHHLSFIQNKALFVDFRIVDLVFENLTALGSDSRKGDGLSSCLQGLIFNVKVWDSCSMATKIHLLDNAAAIATSIGDELNKFIGIQRILDIVRLYMLPNNRDFIEEWDDTQEQALGDASFKILVVLLDTSISKIEKSRSADDVCDDIEAIVLALEESSNNQLIEKLFGLLTVAKKLIPKILCDSLGKLQFSEATSIHVLRKRCLSSKVRREAVSLLLWQLCEPLRNLPLEIYNIRSRLASMQGIVMSSPSPLIAELSSQKWTEGKRTSLNASSSLSSSAPPPPSTDLKRRMALQSELRDAMKPLEVAWSILAMIADQISRVLKDGSWGTGAGSGATNSVNEVLSVFFCEGPFGSKLDFWLALPMLPPLLSHCDLEVFQRVMMSFIVSLKTDDAQVETICNLPDRFWIKILVDIAVFGSSFSAKDRNRDIDLEESGFSSAGAMMDHREGLATTCAELALDAIATMLEHKTRNHGANAWSSWSCLQNCLKGSCSILSSTVSEPVERKLLQRCFSLVFQKLGRSSEKWNTPMLTCVEKLLVLVDKKGLCGQGPSIMAAASIPNLSEDVDQNRSQTPEDEQTLFFLIDTMAALRKCSGRLVLEGADIRLLRISTRILLMCMRVASERTVDRIANEIVSTVLFFMSGIEAWSSDGFQEFIKDIFARTHIAVKQMNTSSFIRDRLIVMVFTLCHQFIELRHSTSSGEKILDHVLPTMEAMTGIDTCTDVDVIFRLVEVNMQTASLISFEDDVNDDFFELPDVTSRTEPESIDSQSPVVSDIQDYLRIDVDDFKSEESLVVNHLPESESIPRNPSIHEKISEYRENQFSSYIASRLDLISSRLESERIRSEKFKRGVDLANDSASAHWTKLKRSIEGQCFDQSHHCQWKLAVAQEGPFPGRKRVVLRPRFKFDIDRNARGAVSEYFSDGKVSEEDIRLALAAARVSSIEDTTSSEEIICPSDAGQSVDHKLHVSEWSEGLEDNFGEAGGSAVPDFLHDDDIREPASEETLSAKPLAKNLKSEDIVLEDFALVDESVKRGKSINTGPCPSGARFLTGGTVIQTANVILVTASGSFWGKLTLTKGWLYFVSTFEGTEDQKKDSAAVQANSGAKIRRRKWMVSHISAVYRRRYRLRDSAMEIFFKRGRHKHFFVDFGHTNEDLKVRNDFAIAVMMASPSTAFKHWQMLSSYRLVNEVGVQEKWLNGELSNFEYLMALNTISGRTYNDLCQYPVMPWVISQYTEPSIDLSDPQNYRDLSKPMGALNEHRLRDFLERYDSFAESATMDIPPFMYGSHYSTMVGVVLHFLVRLQPFASLHKEMQNGRFDVPDRLFSSIPRTFRQNTTQLSEVKELTPEWFTTPEMFKNINNFDLGRTQEGDNISDVELPPWAHSAEEFVRINREAMESEYVSAHLHEWIDLIFGYKQRGAAAIEAHNVFYYLTYSGSVDRSMIKDEALRRATELQIAHFGQIPMQLFRTPHPPRKKSTGSSSASSPRPLEQCFPSLSECHGASDISFVAATNDEEYLSSRAHSSIMCRRIRSNAVKDCSLQNGPCGNILSVLLLREKIVCVLDSGVLEVYRYFTSEAAKTAISVNAALRAKAMKKLSSESKDPTISSALVPDLISFDDSDDIPTPSSNTGSSVGHSSNLVVLENFLEQDENPVIEIEKDTTHFETLPRVFLPRYYVDNFAEFSRLGSALHTLTPIERSVRLVHFTARKLILSGGLVDGSISVRSWDQKTSSLVSAGDFLGHRNPVICFASDFIAGTPTDVIASCDTQGQVLVWTIYLGKRSAASEAAYVMSKRAQRSFRTEPCLESCLSLSSEMGILVVSSFLNIRVFSIERDELFKRIDLSAVLCGCDWEDGNIVSSPSLQRISHSNPFCEFTTNRVSAVDNSGSEILHEKLASASIKSIAVCDSGFIAVSVEGILSSGEPRFLILSLYLSGTVTGVYSGSSSTTFMDCPNGGSTLIVGSENGIVTLLKCDNLKVIFTFSPSSQCKATCNLQKSGKHPMTPSLMSFSSNAVGPAPIVSVIVGPDPCHPALMCISTSGGELFLRPLPDFLKWERNRAPSALAQLVSRPLQAVKGTLQQAQNLGVWTTEQAESLAQNARLFADDAIGELKKINKGSILKGVGNFFGLK